MLSRQIAQKLRGYETPFYLYDTALLRQTLESVVYESKKYGYKVHYAIKANYDDHLLAIIREYGLGIDCASGNELRKAVEAGFDPKGIVYAGVGKRDKELRYAIGQEIMAINCESIEELELVDRLAGEAGKKTDVALRINPDIDPKTNHCIDTGQADSKFGISYEEVLEHAKEIKSLKHINIVGIHLHIGSQIRELHVFENMCNKVNVIVENLEKLGFSFRFVDVGGGLGVNYDVPENEPIPNFASLFSIVHNHLAVGDREVHFEFGRSIVAECGEPMTLQRCLELGLEQNYDVRIIRNEQRISDNDATAANAGMLPSVDLTAGYSGALDNERTTPREGDAVTENGIYDQTFDAGVAVNWTLFDGFRIRTNYKRLQELQQMGALRTRITIEDFVATLTAEYYNYVQQTLRLSNFRYAVQLSRERLRITEERFKIGSFSRLDLLQARVDFNADSSKYMSQHELVTASRIRINELLANDDLNGRLSICDSLIEVNSTLEWDRLEAETRAANASLLLAGHDNTLAELDLKSIRSRFYPYLNLTAGYGYTYNRFGNGATQSRGTLGLNAGVKLGFTIFDGNRRREQRNARITIENTELTRQQLEQSLMANLSNFWQAYRNNLEVIQLETENLIAARENYEIAMERYLLGDLPGIEMREAQKSLLDAEERILTAQYNTKLCEISLQQISGNIGVYLQ